MSWSGRVVSNFNSLLGDGVGVDQRDPLADKIVAIPDKLAAVELYLRPFCNGVAPADTEEARKAIADACELLHSARADVLDVLRVMQAWPALSTLSAANPGAKRLG